MFVRLICIARRLEKRRLQLIKEKQDAYALSRKEEVKLSRKQKYRHFCHDLQRRITRIFCPKFPKHSCPYRLCFSIRHNGTCENYVVKSIAGFLGGFLLTYVFFMFFVLQLNFTLSTATIMCAIFGSILTLGLAFSYKVRCIVFLVLPQFFSKKGRQALLAYAYILAITGPAKNTLNNMSILGESLACGQEQLKAAVKQILEVIKKPFYAIRDAIKKVITTVKEIVKKIKDILLGIKKIIMSLVHIVKSAFDFIARILNVCNSEFGSPFQRCERVFEDAIVDCNAKLGPMFNWLCNITYLVKNVCYVAKAIDFLCYIVDFIKGTVTAIITKVKQFVRHIRTMFYVRIKFSHSYHFESNHTKSMGDITTGIVTEIKQRSSGLIKIFDFMSSAASVFFIFMVVKVIYYRHKFLTNEMFDNKFITKDFRLLDIRRAQLGLETILPLNHRERKLYISTGSMRLVKKEKSRLSQAAMILLMSTLKLSTHMATDFSLYWIMTKIRYYGRFQSKVDAPNMPGVSIEGEGFLAMLLKGIVKAFQPLGINLEIDTVPCLPDPIPPDYDRYIQIGSLLILCWFLAIFEPYGLRFRHSVMCFYHPQRARERSIWLYNHILRSRSSFLKFARRQLRRKVMGDKSINKITCKEFLRSRIVKFPLCVFLFGAGKQQYCLLCGEVYREGDKKTFIKCQTPNCPGFFCEQCFNDLQNLCTVCLDPISYGDMSDISEEKDSSEDEAKKQRKSLKEEEQTKKKKKKKRKKKEKIIKYPETSDDDDDDKKLLLPTKDKDDTDVTKSDWDSGWSSDYDMDYQKFKDVSKISSDVTPRTPHTDIEKQHIPHLATMQDFYNPVGPSPFYLDDAPEELDTSSMITDLNELSMKHLNYSRDDPQSWLMKKSHKMHNLSEDTSYISKSSLPTETSPIQEYYTSIDSEYDTVLDGKDIPMKRLSSKVSFAQIVEELNSGSNTETNLSTPGPWASDSWVEDTTTPTSIPETPFEEHDKSGRPMTKEEKNMINQATSMEKISLSAYDTPATESERTHTINSDEFETYEENELEYRENELFYLYEYDADLEMSPLKLDSSEGYTSPEVSPLVMTCSISSNASNKSRSESTHPDVPKLDLQFLEQNQTQTYRYPMRSPPIKSQFVERFCTCHKNNTSRTTTVDTWQQVNLLTGTSHYTDSQIITYETRSEGSACNCHYFKDRVTYSVVDEYEVLRSALSRCEGSTAQFMEENDESTTSSLISDCRRSHVVVSRLKCKEPKFDMSLAKQDTLTSAVPKITETIRTTRDESMNTSQRSVRWCSLDETTTNYEGQDEDSYEYSGRDEGTDYPKSTYTSTTTPGYHFVDSSDTETVFAIPREGTKNHFVVENVRSNVYQRDLYKERVRNYYKHLNVKSDGYDSVQESEDIHTRPGFVTKKFNPFRTVLNMFGGRKVKYHRCNIEDK